MMPLPAKSNFRKGVSYAPIEAETALFWFRKWIEYASNGMKSDDPFRDEAKTGRHNSFVDITVQKSEQPELVYKTISIQFTGCSYVTNSAKIKKLSRKTDAQLLEVIKGAGWRTMGGGR